MHLAGLAWFCSRNCRMSNTNKTPLVCCRAFAENCVVVAEGEMGLDGVFRVNVLAFPGCESRAQLPATAQVRHTDGGVCVVNISAVLRSCVAPSTKHTRPEQLAVQKAVALLQLTALGQ